MFRKQSFIFRGVPFCSYTRTDSSKIVDTNYWQLSCAIRASGSFHSVCRAGRERVSVFTNPIIIPIVISSHIPRSEGFVFLFVPLDEQERIHYCETIDIRINHMPGTFRAALSGCTVIRRRSPGMTALRAQPIIFIIIMQG